MSLKQVCDQLGITLGCGLVDAVGANPFPDGGYADSNPDVQLILNNFGGITLHAYAYGASGVHGFDEAPDVRGVETWIGPYEYDWSACDAAYNWAISKGLKVSIQNPEYSFNYNDANKTVYDEQQETFSLPQQFFPSWIANADNTPKFSRAELTNMLHAFLTSCYTRYPLTSIIHCCNERFQMPNWIHENSTIGTDAVTAFAITSQWIRAINPNAKIIYNQSQITLSSSYYIARAQEIRAAGGFIDGVADQGHYPVGGIGDVSLYPASFAALFAANLEPMFTEIDVRCPTTADIPGQQRTYQELLQVAVAAGVKEFSIWGARSPSWLESPTQGASPILFNEDRTEAPAYSAVMSALSTLAGAPKVAHRLRSPSGGKIKGKGPGKVSGKPQ